MSTRIVLEFNDRQAAEIQKMLDETSVSMKKELFNNALTLLKWSLKEKKEGKSIGSLDSKDSYKEVAMPILDSVTNE